MGVIPARYLTGFGSRMGDGELEIGDAGVAFFRGRRKAAEFEFAWPDVRTINFDDPGRTKANGAAIFAFGVLGMASRRAFSIVTVNAKDLTGHFETEWPVGTWRGIVPQIFHEVPLAAGKLFVQGEDLSKPAPTWGQGGPTPEPVPSEDPIDSIARLGKLRDAGLLSPEEFEAKKQELLKRI